MLFHLRRGIPRMQLTIIAALFVAIAGVVFAIQNHTSVSVDFFIWQFSSPLALVLLLAVASGAIVVALLTTPATLRRQWLISQQRKRIEALEKQIAGLRSQAAEANASPHGGENGTEIDPEARLIQRDASEPGNSATMSAPTSRIPQEKNSQARKMGIAEKAP